MIIAFWRTIFLYILVIFCLRFMGKRQIGELQPSELVTTIMISNIAAIPIENMGTPLISSVIPILLLACFELISSGISLKSKKARSIIMGNPRTVIHDGNIVEEELYNLRWSIDDLMEQLRGEGYFSIEEVMFAVVETNGKLSIYPKFKYSPVTNGSMDIPLTSCDSPSVVIISDGVLLEQGLDFCEKNQDWLTAILNSSNITLKDVFIMTCNRDGKFNIVRKVGR